MKTYRTLSGDNYSVEQMPARQREVFEEVLAFYETSPDAAAFWNYWQPRVAAAMRRTPRREIVQTPLFRICQDLGSRLGIAQGKMRPVDYRDQLAELIDARFASRYQASAAIGVHESYLSQVLNRKKHLSLPKLESLLEQLGCELAIREKTEGPV